MGETMVNRHRKVATCAVAMAWLASLAALLAVVWSSFEAHPWICPRGEIIELRFAPNDRVFSVQLMRMTEKPAHRVLVVDAATKAVLLEVDGVRARVVCFDSKGKQLAVLWPQSLTVYDLATAVKRFEVPEAELRTIDAEVQSCQPWLKPTPYSIAFSDDGKHLILTPHFGPRCVDFAWELSNGRRTLEHRESHNWAGQNLARDRSKWFHGIWPGPSPRVYQQADGHRITYCFRFPFHIFADFTTDNAGLITIHSDGALLLWEIRETDNENASIRHSEFLTGLETSRAFALLHRTRKLAFIDAAGQLRYRPLLGKAQ